MKRHLFLAYGLVCYTLFLAAYVYLAGFVGNFLVPKSMDGPAQGSFVAALLINLSLVAAFSVSHSVMARPWFKRWWTQFVPKPIERSTYVLVSTLFLALLMWQWRPMGGIIWDVQSPTGRAILYGLFALGWLGVPLVSLLINHFDLFGLRQVWLHAKQKDYTHLPFRVPGVYRIVRHPLYVAWILFFWATPTMTVAHLVFAAGLTAYILIAIPFEERDLVAHHGEQYKRYRKQVPALIPLGTGADKEELLATNAEPQSAA